MTTLPTPPEKYDPQNEAQMRALVERSLSSKQDRTGDHSPDRLILVSPDGTRWRVTVSDLGALSAVSL